MENQEEDADNSENEAEREGGLEDVSEEELEAVEEEEEDNNRVPLLANGHMHIEVLESSSDEDEALDDNANAPQRMFRMLATNRRADDSSDEDSQDKDEVENREAYDSELPGQHQYLGEGKEVGGRTILDDDLIQDLPLLPGGTLGPQLLVPGQTLPLTLFHPAVISMMKNIINSTKTFGVISLPIDKENNIGTTAEIFEYREPSEDSAEVGLKLKARGRQRFRLLSMRRQADGNLLAKVTMLNDVSLEDPLHSIRLSSLDRFRLYPSTPTPASSPEAPPTTTCFSSLLASLRPDKSKPPANKPEYVSSPSSRSRQYRRGVLPAPLTPLPPWIYSMYDPSVLVHRMHTELAKSSKIWSLAPVRVPVDPVDLSWWVLLNFPMEDDHRSNILAINSPIQRLRAELSILEMSKVLVCRRCGEQVADQSDIFSMSKEGPQGAYVNAHGAVHETLTVYKAKNLRLLGQPSTEYSWFPGYSWTITECGGCGDHTGWKFIATTRKLSPDKFYGFSRRSVEPKVEIPSSGVEEPAGEFRAVM